jgi:hypothetical protein
MVVFVSVTLGKTLHGPAGVNVRWIYLFDGCAGGTKAPTSADAATDQIAVWENQAYDLTANNYNLVHEPDSIIVRELALAWSAWHQCGVSDRDADAVAGRHRNSGRSS